MPMNKGLKSPGSVPLAVTFSLRRESIKSEKVQWSHSRVVFGGCSVQIMTSKSAVLTDVSCLYSVPPGAHAHTHKECLATWTMYMNQCNVGMHGY
jgi:hypothetical protein